MRIIYIIIICAFIGTLLLWLGRFNYIKRTKAAILTAVSIVTAGVLLLLAVLPNNSFYGSVITHCDVNKKVIALTFDDGPYPPYTQKLLQVLQEKNVPATFFMVGENAILHPQTVKEVQAHGHDIQLHAGYHKDLLKLTASETAANISYGKNTLEKITGTKIKYMRPPHGFKDWSVMQNIHDANLQVVNWSIIPRDWTNPGAEIIASRVCNQAEPGAIVLLHDGDSPKNKAPRQQTIDAVKIIIDQLRAQGYEFVTVDTLLTMEKTQTK